MKITELEIRNISECKHVHMQFPPGEEMGTIFVIRASQQCEVISLALQLICSTRYATLNTLAEIHDKIVNGQVNITFTLKESEQQQQPNPSNTTSDTGLLDHSSDSDVPCTSRQAQERREKRLRKRSRMDKAKGMLQIKACRDFTKNPDVIKYSINNGPEKECYALTFQLRFFTCTDVIFPRLSGLKDDEYINGKWLDLLSMEFSDAERDKTNLVIKFCNLYADRKVNKDHILSKLTTAVLQAGNSLDHAHITQLINIFNEIRCLFEYITCMEYTVWFLLPTWFGHKIDISRITTENVNFDLMKTYVQFKTPTMDGEKFLWTLADGHIKELLLVAIQIVFGNHCQQNIIYLHSLEKLKSHHNFQFVKHSMGQANNLREYYYTKNYFQRILNVCAKLDICCIVEYSGGLPIYPRYAFVIKCEWLNASREWKICLRDTGEDATSADILKCLQNVANFKLLLNNLSKK